MLCKFQNDRNKNSKLLLTKATYKMCKWKGTKKPYHCKNCTAVQNTEGWDMYNESLWGKSKSTNHFKVQCDAWLE